MATFNEANQPDMRAENDVIEASPLLGNRVQAGKSHDANAKCLVDSTDPSSTIVLYFMTIHFLLAFSEIILIAPLMKLFENSLCLKHYKFPSAGVDESLCKIAKIQHPLATIRGIKAMFDTVPGIRDF
jgi:hypothetical protein